MGRHKKEVFKICNQCGINFKLKRSGVDRLFCSRSCSSKGRYIRRVDPVDGVVDLTTLSKECTSCNILKQKLDFTIVRKKRDGYVELSLRNKCKKCYQETKKDYDRDYLKKQVCVSGVSYSMGKQRSLKQIYGISLEQYHLMKEQQSNRCAICEKDFSGLDEKQIHVDHDHLTGKVIAVLCGLCNVGIGALQENPMILEKAKEYIIKNKTYESADKPPYK